MKDTCNHGHAAHQGCNRLTISCIIPPHLLKKLLENKEKTLSDAALRTLLATTHLRGERTVRSMTGLAAAPDTGRRSIYDCRQGRQLPNARLSRTENGNPSNDQAVNRAFDSLGKTRDFYKRILSRDSIDGRGMRLNGYVHYGLKFQNAFWDGQEMVFGDGDGVVFDDFTKSLDVVAHELTHGVTEHTANLEYHNQSGALNESVSDVFGSLVKQWSLNQDAQQADWLIGTEIFTPGIGADALRSMKAPGTAYDNQMLGRDPQPDHMNNYQEMPDTEIDDWGGVHINSGIPNKAFYLTAINIGGRAWEAPGHIWYESLKASTETTQFQEFAETTFAKAGQLYQAGSVEQKAVASAWADVGIRAAGGTLAARATYAGNGHADNRGDSMAELTSQIEMLGDQLRKATQSLAELATHR